MFGRQVDKSCERHRGGFVIDDCRELTNDRDGGASFVWRELSATAKNRERIRHFERPQRPMAAQTSAGESADLPRVRLRMRCCNSRSPSTDRLAEARSGVPSRTTRAIGRS